MSDWQFVAWDRLDPLGTQLGELTDAFDRTILASFDGPGSGAFQVNRHSSQIGWVRTGTYVKVHLEGIANPAVHAFFIEEGADTVVSLAEEGGEDFKRGGRGSLVYLERAIVDHIQRTANQFSIDAADAELVWDGRRLGRILLDLIEEAEARTPNPLADMTHATWTATTDSAGNTWDIVDGEFRIPIGLDLLAAIETLRGQGLYVVMTPDLGLKAYQDYTGTLRSITFAKGVNIREAAERAVHASPAKSRLLVQGTRKSGTIIYKTSTDASVEADIGAHEGFMRYGKTATLARLEKAGQRQLAALKRASDGATTIGVTVGDGTAGLRGTAGGHYVPFTHYFPGDRVTILVPGIYDTLVKPIDGIVLEDTEAGEYDPSIMFDVPNYIPSIGEAAAGGGKDFGGGEEGGGGGAPSEPAATETVNCDTTPVETGLQYQDTEHDPHDYVGLKAGSGDNEVGSWVWYNHPWSVTGCPIGGGGWDGFHDEEQWFEFTAPADDPDYLGMTVTIDATALTWGESGPLRFPFRIRIAQGAVTSTRFGEGQPLGEIAEGATATIYIPRSHLTWGGANCIIIAPTWQCVRGAFYCNETASFIGTREDGRGNSASASGFSVGDVCALRFVAGQTSKMATDVAAYGAVDGDNTVFTLIGWDGTGTPTATLNSLDVPVGDITFDTGAKTATLAFAPAALGVLLWSYPVTT